MSDWLSPGTHLQLVDGGVGLRKRVTGNGRCRRPVRWCRSRGVRRRAQALPKGHNPPLLSLLSLTHLTADPCMPVQRQGHASNLVHASRRAATGFACRAIAIWRSRTPWAAPAVPPLVRRLLLYLRHPAVSAPTVCSLPVRRCSRTAPLPASRGAASVSDPCPCRCAWLCLTPVRTPPACMPSTTVVRDYRRGAPAVLQQGNG